MLYSATKCMDADRKILNKHKENIIEVLVYASFYLEYKIKYLVVELKQKLIQKF